MKTAPWRFAACVLFSPLPTSFAGDLIPFVIPAKPNPNSLIALPAAAPIGPKSGRIIVRDAQFQRDGERIKLWGVNLSFGANFPSREDAPHVAARLASVGVNTVRLHHMDTASWPRGLWNRQNPSLLSEEALERLDFFIDQLARQGIWININLHVGREHSRHLDLPEPNRKYDKIVCLFTPEIIQAQKKFARDLLSRVNPYRQIRYADDPAVAVVEITNENSFFMWDAEQTLRTLPPYYAGLLQNQYNDWLKKRHPTREHLRRAWDRNTEPLGPNLLRNSNLRPAPEDPRTVPDWSLEQHENCRASLGRVSRQSREALSIRIERRDDTEWHLQFKQGNLKLEAGKFYTVSLVAASGQPRKLGCGVSMAHDPWTNLGFSQSISLTPEWQEFTFGFVARQTEENARLSFTLGSSPAPVYLAQIRFHRGGRVGLAPEESPDQANVRLFGRQESPSRIMDRMRFLAAQEKEYFDGMKNFLRTDLQCRALVTGTIVFGPLGLHGQSDMDFIDAHAYWQHPRFPGRPWDQGNWIIDQKPMVDHPEEATLFRLAAERLAGKPFTVSEYNHPAPMDSQAECVPMIAAFAAAQDWDGVWLYTYSHDADDWDREHLSGFFDLDTNPAKWGFMRAGTAMFREGVIAPLAGFLAAPLADSPDPLQALIRKHLQYDRNLFEAATDTGLVTREHLLKNRFWTALQSTGAMPQPIESPTEISWSADQGRGFFMVGGGAGLAAGNTVLFDKSSGGYARISSPAYAVITATPLDGRPWPESRRILLTACGRSENTGMKFSRDRTTVGRDWGESPVRIEPVEGRVMVPGRSWHCQALASDGTAREDVPLRREENRSYLTLSPRHQTMWYLLTRR